MSFGDSDVLTFQDPDGKSVGCQGFYQASRRLRWPRELDAFLPANPGLTQNSFKDDYET